MPPEVRFKSRVSRKGASGWTPTSLGSKLLAWWSADRADLLSLSGSAVITWTDSVHGYALTQGTSGARPVYSATSFGGAPGVAFDGTDDYLALASTPLPTGSNPCGIWSVASQDSDGSDATERSVFGYGGATANTARRLGRILNAGKLKASFRIGSGSSNIGMRAEDPAAPEYLGRMVSRAVAVNNNCSVTLNNTVPSVRNDAGVATGTTRTCLGCADSLSAFWMGKVRDLIVTQPLNDDEAARMWAFTMARRNV